jgi:hypothetical protein
MFRMGLDRLYSRAPKVKEGTYRASDSFSRRFTADANCDCEYSRPKTK